MRPRSTLYGWWAVAAFSVMTFTSTGIGHAVGMFLKPIVASPPRRRRTDRRLDAETLSHAAD